MKLSGREKRTNDNPSNHKRNTSCEEGQLETTLASFNESESYLDQIIFEDSPRKVNSLNPIAATLMKDPSHEKPSQGEFEKWELLHDEEEYRPAKARRLSIIKYKQNKKTKADAKKGKKIKKDKTKRKNVSKRCQFDESICYDEQMPNHENKIEENNDPENPQEDPSKKAHICAHSINQEALINSNCALTVKIEERTHQIISMEMYTKLLRSYQELLNEKIQSDQQYLKNIKILVRQNTRLYRQNQFHRTKVPLTQSEVKLEFESIEDHPFQLIQETQPIPIVIEYPLKNNQAKESQVHPLQILQNPLQSIQVSQKCPSQNDHIELQVRQENFIGDLSSFGSSKDSFQDTDQKVKKSLLGNTQPLTLKSKDSDNQILKDTQKDHKLTNRQYQCQKGRKYGRFIKIRNVQAERETIFYKRRKNRQIESSNSSLSSPDRNQTKKLRKDMLFRKNQQNWSQKHSRRDKSQNINQRKRNEKRYSNFPKEDKKSKEKVVKKYGIWGQSFSRQKQDHKKEKWAVKKAKPSNYSAEKSSIEY